MLQSRLFAKTQREAPKDDISVNAELLVRAGFASKLIAGVWTFLPLGWRVLEKINTIIRQEMNAIGGVELHMPTLQPRDLWEVTDRWKVEEMYKLQDRGGRELGLGWTHEETITHIALPFISSYRDLPQYVYQIQTKFRDEPRAKSGVVRGREFFMKDLYSFHTTREDLDSFYEITKDAYHKIFSRLGLKAYCVEASGGAFTKEFSHEFQVVSEAGEDEIIYCKDCAFARNKEVIGDLTQCPQCKKPLATSKSIEVGNIFKLGTKFSEAFGLVYTDERGEKQPVVMGSYGIGPGRLVGTIAEVSHDERGLIWPEAVAPARVHVLALSPAVQKEAESLVFDLEQRGVEVLFDDREGKTPGERFSDADLIGLPWRVVVSEKTVKEGKIEVKKRTETDATLMGAAAFTKLVC